MTPFPSRMRTYFMGAPSQDEMRKKSNLEKDKTSLQQPSTTTTTTSHRRHSTAALQAVAHPSDGGPELLDDHNCKIVRSSVTVVTAPHLHRARWVSRRATTYLASSRRSRPSARCRSRSPRRRRWQHCTTATPACLFGPASRLRGPVS